jgi:hypothetical protein
MEQYSNNDYNAYGGDGGYGQQMPPQQQGYSARPMVNPEAEGEVDPNL